MSDPKERRLGHVLLQALTLACVQRDIDTARRLEAVLECEIRRRGPNGVERRKQWPTAVERAREHVRALERSMRRSQAPLGVPPPSTNLPAAAVEGPSPAEKPPAVVH